jgi:hypothetical protein
MDRSAEGIHDVGGTTIMPFALAKRVEPESGSPVSEKFRKLPSARIRSAGVRIWIAGTLERFTIAVLAAQQVEGVGCGMNGIVWRTGG